MKKLVAIVTVIALFCTLLMSTPVSAKAKPKPTVIDVYEGQDITEAVNSANEGDVVFVHKGVYPGEDKVVNGFHYRQAIWISGKTNITVKGEKGTILEGANSTLLGIRVSLNPNTNIFTSGVTIEGFEIRDFTYFGITLITTNGNLVENNKISGGVYGIDLVHSNDNSISNNNISSVQDGIVLNGASNNYISNNQVATSALGIGVRNSEPNNLANGNTIEKNTVNSAGMGIIIVGNSNQVIQNEILSVYDGIYVCFDTNLTLDSENNLIEKNKVTCTHDGNSAINLVCVHNNTVSQNEVSNSYFGISMYGVLNTGTIFYGVGNNNISQNTVTDSRWFGIAAWDGASGNTIEKNEVSGSISYDLFDISAPSLNIWDKNDYGTKNW